MSQTSPIHAETSAFPSLWGENAPAIYQTAAFAYPTAEGLEDVFAGRAPGYVYSRIANPTVSDLERRLAGLEGGMGGIATASGMAAISSVVLGLLRAGDHLVAARGMFGGTTSLLATTLGRLDITTDFVEASDTCAVADVVQEQTRLIFVETIGNPKMDIPDLPAIAEVAGRWNIPLVVDSTVTSPALVRSKDAGASLVVHSTSKFINGHGTAIGGMVIDTGNYDWTNSPFDHLRPWVRKAGQRAFALINNLKLARNAANIGEVKTLVIHPASTIFREFEPAMREQMGVPDDLVRVSVGIEDFQDIQKDFEQALTCVEARWH